LCIDFDPRFPAGSSVADTSVPDYPDAARTSADRGVATARRRVFVVGSYVPRLRFAPGPARVRLGLLRNLRMPGHDPQGVVYVRTGRRRPARALSLRHQPEAALRRHAADCRHVRWQARVSARRTAPSASRVSARNCSHPRVRPTNEEQGNRSDRDPLRLEVLNSRGDGRAVAQPALTFAASRVSGRRQQRCSGGPAAPSSTVGREARLGQTLVSTIARIAAMSVTVRKARSVS
jgi:hypothetical protein